MKKIMIISHAGDIDGLGCPVLGNLVFTKENGFELDYVLTEVSGLSSIISKMIESKDYENYDEIYITDLSIRNESITEIDKCEGFKNRLKHFDHHASELGSNVYPFINVATNINGEPVCGTSMLYAHIKDNYPNEILNKESVEYFVEAVRCRDNWIKNKEEWQLGCDLTELQLISGNDNFIREVSDALLNDKDLISSQNKGLIKRRQESILEYIDVCDTLLIPVDIDGRKVGAIFAEQFRSELGNALSQRHPELDYILIIDFMRGSYSFRTTKDDVNVSEVAKTFDPGAGGHPKAAGSPITSENVHIIKKVLDEKYCQKRVLKN